MSKITHPEDLLSDMNDLLSSVHTRLVERKQISAQNPVCILSLTGFRRRNKISLHKIRAFVIAVI